MKTYQEWQDKDCCPICNEKANARCRCIGPHTMEDLKKGHGLRCSNGHRWSYDTKDKKLVVLAE
jgi:hypothetical protein